jgi:hypothetical protein
MIHQRLNPFMPAILTKLKNSWNETALWQKVALMAFVLNFFLVAQIFLPNLGSINVWDEADYVTSGKFFVEGLWPSYSWNPFVAVVYAVFYLMTRHSPFWFLESVTLGRVILFCLLWLSCYLIARELKNQIHPAWILGIAFVSPLRFRVLAAGRIPKHQEIQEPGGSIRIFGAGSTFQE